MRARRLESPAPGPRAASRAFPCRRSSPDEQLAAQFSRALVEEYFVTAQRPTPASLHAARPASHDDDAADSPRSVAPSWGRRAPGVVPVLSNSLGDDDRGLGRDPLEDLHAMCWLEINPWWPTARSKSGTRRSLTPSPANAAARFASSATWARQPARFAAGRRSPLETKMISALPTTSGSTRDGMSCRATASACARPD